MPQAKLMAKAVEFGNSRSRRQGGRRPRPEHREGKGKEDNPGAPERDDDESSERRESAAPRGTGRRGAADAAGPSGQLP